MVRDPAFVVVSTWEDHYLGTKILVPDNPIGYIAVECVVEAHFICGILNSAFAPVFHWKAAGHKISPFSSNNRADSHTTVFS